LLVVRVEVYKAGGSETVCVEEIELHVYLLVQIYSQRGTDIEDLGGYIRDD